MTDEEPMAKVYSFNRAFRISHHLTDAQNHLDGVVRSLTSAYAIASDDYEYNDEVIGELCGAVHILRKALIHEDLKWRGYTDAREEHLKQ